MRNRVGLSVALWIFFAGGITPVMGQAGGAPSARPDGEVRSRDSFYLDFGPVTPFDPNGFSDSWAVGTSGGFGFGFGLSRLLALVVDANYNNFPVKSVQSGFPGVTFSGGAIHLSSLMGNLKLNFVGGENPLIPYVILGMGGAYFASDALTATDDSSGIGVTTDSTVHSETDFAARFGLGMEIRLGRGTYLFLETNGVKTFVSETVANDGILTYNMTHLGVKLDM